MSAVINSETIRKMSRDELLEALDVEDAHESGDEYLTDDNLRDLYCEKLAESGR